jgi:hypothetical protein
MISCLTVMVAVFLFGSPAFAQLPPGLPIPPENFAVTHFWGSPSAISIRHVSMGGAYAADDRGDWHGNPAGLVVFKKPTFLASRTISSFHFLPTFRSTDLGYAYPFGKNAPTSVKLTLIRVRASGVITNTPVPIRLQANENDVGLEIGRRVNKRLSCGVALAYLSTDSTYEISGVGTVTALRSHPSGPGGRIGLIYDLGSKLSLGVTYDNYTETVSRAVPAFQLPTGTFRFHSTAYRPGLAFRPDSKTTVLLDYEALNLVGNGTVVARRFRMGGIERKTGLGRLRVGTFDGKLTGGIGIDRGRLQFSYGFTGRYDKALPGQGARTAHAFELTVKL